MKKVISIVLSLAIIFSTLTCVFTGTVGALEDENYYDLVSNYYCYVANNTLGGEAGGPAPTADTTEVHTEGGSSVQFAGMHGRVAAVKLKNIEVGKTYKLVAWYKGTPITNSGRDPLSYDLRTPGIYAAGTAVGSNGALTNPVSSINTINKVADTEWHRMSVTFTATSNDLYFAINSWCASSFWLDDITLTETDLHYENASNYYSYVTNNTLGGEAGGTAPTVDATVAHTEGESSIKFAGMHGRVAAVKLNNIEVGKSYKLSVWFKGTADTIRNPATYDAYTPGIYAAGTAVGTNGTLTNAISSVATISKIADTDWHNISITFTATSADLYFATRIWCGYYFWLADITLTEVDLYYDTASNYYSYASGNTIGEAGTTPTVDTTTAHTEGESSIKFAGMHGRAAAVKLKNIEVGETYKISAWFKGTANTARTTPSYDVQTPGIYAAGTAVGTNGALTDAISSVANITYIADTDWHEISIVFTATSTDLYLAMRIWCGVTFWLDDITVTKWYKEYDYKAYDFENGFFGDSFPYNGAISDNTQPGVEGAVTSVISEETENPVSGASSYKYFWGNPGTNWAFLTPKTNENLLLNNANYRVSGKYVLQQNEKQIASITFGSADALMKTHTQGEAAIVRALNGKYDSGEVYSFNGKITTVVAGYPAIHGYTQGDYTTDYVLLDDITYAQIIDTVSATSADTSMGSASVANKAGYDDYAVNETAVFTAIPVNGYYFEGWYDEDGNKVSADRVYETTLITDTNLTAKFLAYDTLYTISFNTNGGNEIDPISNGAGGYLVFPEAPVKAGFAFAGWYLDAELTTPFTAKAFPAEDITLYAKWANSAQGFEDYTALVGGNFTAMTDGENSYTGNGYLKYSATEKDNGQSRFVLSGSEALKDFATPGDQIKLSFKYKLLSGDAKYYLHTSAAGDQVNLTKDATGNWLNVYKYKQVNLTASEDWQELSVTYDLKSYSEITAIGATLDDFLYTVLIFSSENGAEFYIDDVTLDVIPGIKVKTAYNSAAALRSAAASSTGKNGVRIYNEIDTHWVAEKSIVEYGSVAAFASNIEGEITLDNGRKGVAYSAADGISSVWEVTEHTVVFTSYLTNIATSKYNEDILIRSYAIAADGTVYYGSTATVSVFEVANAIDNANTADGSEPTEEDANAFYTFVTDANSADYASWCAENEKTLGALYNGKYSA